MVSLCGRLREVAARQVAGGGRWRELASRHHLFLANIGVSAGLSGLGDLMQQRLETARAKVQLPQPGK